MPSQSGSLIARMDEVMARFEQAEAAIAPVYDMSQVIKDEQLNHIGTIATVEDPDLGPVKMQNILFRTLRNARQHPAHRARTRRGHGRGAARARLRAGTIADLRTKGD